LIAAALVIAAIALAMPLAIVQIASMSAYGDLAATPSLPALLHATQALRLRDFIGGRYARARADVHDGNLDAAERLLATLPPDRASDDLHGDIARLRGNPDAAFAWYVRAGDTLQAQAIVDASLAAHPERALRAETLLVANMQRAGASGDDLADAWWKLGVLQRAAGVHDARGDDAAALRSFQRALENAPNRKSYLLAAGIEALKLADDGDAVKYLTHAIEVGPGKANAYGALALAYAAQHECALARGELAAWQQRSDPGARPPQDDPHFGAPLRACLQAGAAAAPAPAPPAATPAAETGPRIFHVAVTPRTVHSFSNVSGTVETSRDVVSVYASAEGIPPQRIPRLGPGSFGESARLPWMPSFIHGTYPVTFTAYDAAGRSASAVLIFAVQ
jgi:tetratricopeptide (TPR) repeat protein